MNRPFLHLCAAALLTFSATAPTLAQSTAALEAGFRNPPPEARPMVRWWWFGPAVTKPELLRELQQMQADGIGGAELAFVYPLQLEGNLDFVSPAMLDMVTYAQAESRRLGLRIDVTLCSGWPYGGPHISLANAATRLRNYEVDIPAHATSVSFPGKGSLHGQVPASNHSDDETLISIATVDGQPGHWNADSAQSVAAPSDPKSLSVAIAPADHERVALFFFAGHTRQAVKRAAVGAEGYVLDPFSHDAVAAHLKAIGEPLLSAFGSTPPHAIFSDSLEAYGADWTPSLPAEFARRRGYDLLPHLPELLAGGTPGAERVRHDYGVTLTELINQNYLVQINDWAHAHHTLFRSQTYGTPAVSLSSQHLVDLAEGEGPQWRAFSTLRWASSANHIFGNPITSGETFTWLHSPVFRATPLDMKAEADVDFLTGENQLIFHGWPYSPPPSELPRGDPGWSLYAAAALNDHNPWHPVMPAVTSYIARLSYLLRQGEPANQVAVLLPTDDAWAGFSPANVSLTGAMSTLVTQELMSAILSAGYNVDFIDAEAIRSNGLGSHSIVILPPTDRIPVDTLKALDNFAAHGGKVLAVGKLPSLSADSKPLIDRDAKLQLVPSTLQLGEALHSAARPDLQIGGRDPRAAQSLGFIRRSLPYADVYFVANTSNEPINTTLGFNTRFPGGETWNPDTGEKMYQVKAAGNEVNLAPYESAIFVFSAEASVNLPPGPSKAELLADLSNDWHVTFRNTDHSLDEHKLSDWISDPATQHFSGEAVYTREVNLARLPATAVTLAIDGGEALPGSPDSTPPHEVTGKDGLPNPLLTKPGPGMHAFYNAPIREAALVVVNGKSAGALWHPPYRLDVSSLLKPGRNTIEIHVFNTALNAWSGIPRRDYSSLKAKYGDRFQMQDLDKVAALPSGIFGRIYLATEPKQ